MDAIAQYPIIGELFMLIKNNLLGAFFVISCFFEFSKIKINPISGAMDYLFKPIRTDISNMETDINERIQKMEEVDTNLLNILQEIKDEAEKDRFITKRMEILTFASSIYNGQLFSEQEYQHIFEIIEQYNELHEIYKFSNGHTDDAIAEIKSHHDKYKDSNVKYF